MNLYEHEMEILNTRLKKQSKRIRKLNEHLQQILTNQRHYLRYRLPDVLQNEKKKNRFGNTYRKALAILEGLGRQHMFPLSHKKLSSSGRRFIGYFTDVEITRLRRLLKRNLKTYIIFHTRKKEVIRLSRNEKSRLKFLLKNSTALDRLVRKKRKK